MNSYETAPLVVVLKAAKEATEAEAARATLTANRLRTEYAAAVLAAAFDGAKTAVFERDWSRGAPRLTQILGTTNYEIDTEDLPTADADELTRMRFNAAADAENAIVAIGSDDDILSQTLFDEGETEHQGWVEFDLNLAKRSKQAPPAPEDVAAAKPATVVTRPQYLDQIVTHDEYYAQFVTTATISVVKNAFGAEVLSEAFAQDRHLNTIDLKRWDAVTMRDSDGKHRRWDPRVYNGFTAALPINRDAIKAAGEIVTASTLTCIAKRAAQMVIEEHNAAAGG